MLNKARERVSNVSFWPLAPVWLHSPLIWKFGILPWRQQVLGAFRQQEPPPQLGLPGEGRAQVGHLRAAGHSHLRKGCSGALGREAVVLGWTVGQEACWGWGE